MKDSRNEHKGNRIISPCEIIETGCASWFPTFLLRITRSDKPIPNLYRFKDNRYRIHTVNIHLYTASVPLICDFVPNLYRYFQRRKSKMQKISLNIPNHLATFIDKKLEELNTDSSEKLTKTDLIVGMLEKAIVENYFGDEHDKYRMALAHNDEVLNLLVEHINDQTNAIFQIIHLMNGTEILEEDRNDNEQ